MNKKMFFVAAIAFILGSTAGIFSGASWERVHAGRIYPQSFRVYSVDRSADIVTLETSTGLLYSFSGVEDWEPGDICAALMNDNGSAIVTDDQVMVTRYAGR